MEKIRTVRCHQGSCLEDFDNEVECFPMGNGDVCFLCKKGILETGSHRKRGIWQMGDSGMSVFFSCPWCGGVNSIRTSLVDRDYASSIWCIKAGCGRHLFVNFEGLYP